MSEFLLPEFLYHGTSAAWVGDIGSLVLAPRRATGNSRWAHSVESRADAVYLTTAYPLHFAANSEIKDDIIIVEVATRSLLPSLLVADEDSLAHAAKTEMSRYNLKERTLFFRDKIQEFPAGPSLRSMGTCAYLGTIPNQAITRVARISAGEAAMLILAGLDPVVSPLNFAIFQREYEQSVRFIFGDEPQLAINPQLPPLNITVTANPNAAH